MDKEKITDTAKRCFRNPDGLMFCEHCDYKETRGTQVNVCRNLMKNMIELIDLLTISDESKEKCTIEQHAEIHRLQDELKQVRKDTALRWTMNKEKEIKEITEAVMCAMEYREKIGTPNFELIAQNLINAGYGNVKQAVKEFAEKLNDESEILDDPNGKYCWDAVKLVDINKLFTELYGDE